MRIEAVGNATLYLGKCEDVLPTLGRVDAIVTDPPYGILNLEGAGSTTAIRKSPRQQGSGTLKDRVLNRADVRWDIAPASEVFDLIRSTSTHQVIWGGNYFPLPPARGILVWDKEQPWPNFSQAEIAWTNLGRPAAVFRLSSGRGEPNKEHPTQKPLPLMLWCLGFLPDARTVCDPYMGSGTTGVAALRLGRAFVGIERDPEYFEIALRRIQQAHDQPALFDAGPPAPPQQLGLEEA